MITDEFKAQPIYQPPFIGTTPFSVTCNNMQEGFGMHWHGELEIIYVLPESQGITVSIDGRVFNLSARDAVFISGTEVHAIESAKRKTEILVIEMGFSLLGQDFSVFSGHRFTEPFISFAKAEHNTSIFRIEKIFNELLLMHIQNNKMSAVRRMRTSALLFELAACMAENLQMTLISEQRIKQLEAVNAVQSVLMFVESSYPSQITLEDAAAISGYEKTRFCQIFKQAVGISFHKYLNSRRLRAAEQLLTATNLPVSQIAQTVGIHQHKTFSRLIKETYGITPSELRLQKRSDVNE